MCITVGRRSGRMVVIKKHSDSGDLSVVMFSQQRQGYGNFMILAKL